MTSVFHWTGAGTPLSWGLLGFWRGLSLKENDPLPPPGKEKWWRI